jgi:hypothetical protein
LVSAPLGPIHLFGGDRFDSRDDVLKLGDGTDCAPGRQPIVLGHRQNERALVCLQAFNRMDGDADHEDGTDAEPSLAAPENHTGSQVVWMAA